MDLPLPLGPSTPNISPRRTEKLMWSTATVPALRLPPFGRFQITAGPTLQNNPRCPRAGSAKIALGADPEFSLQA